MIKFLPLDDLNRPFKEEILSSINEILLSGWFLLGQENETFQKNYANYIGSDYCITTSNGLDALRMIFKAYIISGHLKKGDEVLVPANTYIASILAITQAGLKPILVEPNENTYNLSVENCQKALTRKSKAVLIVHLYGRNGYSLELEKFSQDNNLIIIEDNAQSTGALFSERRTGALGAAAGHSFYPGKNLGAIGDAGAITTDDHEIASICGMLSNYGSSKKYHNRYKGYNCRMDEIQAAALNIKLNSLDSQNQERREIAQRYINEITNPIIKLPYAKGTSIINDLSHVWHLFVIRTKYRDQLQKFLEEMGVQTLIHYPVPPHKQLAYSEFKSSKLKLTETIHNEVLSLPIYPKMSQKHITKIVELINKF